MNTLRTDKLSCHPLACYCNAPPFLRKTTSLFMGFNLHIRHRSLGYIYDHCVLFQAEAFESLVMGPSKVIYLSMEQVLAQQDSSLENKDNWRGRYALSLMIPVALIHTVYIPTV